MEERALEYLLRQKIVKLIHAQVRNVKISPKVVQNVEVLLVTKNFQISLPYILIENCEWNDWQFGECSVSCGGGTRVDTRTKAKEEAYGGTCEEDGNQREVECNIEECPRNILQ